MDTDTTWAEFSNLAATENRRFADTAPASRPMPVSDERSYAPTTPAPLQLLHARPAAPVQRELTVVEVMVEARRNNRVCLKTDPVDRCSVYFFLFLARDLPSDWPFLKLACIF